MLKQKFGKLILILQFHQKVFSLIQELSFQYNLWLHGYYKWDIFLLYWSFQIVPGNLQHLKPVYFIRDLDIAFSFYLSYIVTNGSNVIPLYFIGKWLHYISILIQHYKVWMYLIFLLLEHIIFNVRGKARSKGIGTSVSNLIRRLHYNNLQLMLVLFQSKSMKLI